MKSNARVFILALIALTLMGWYQVLGVAGENKASYEAAIASAEQYAAEGIYEKALDAYTEAITYQDSLEVRRSMNELYLLCMEDGRTRYNAVQYERFLSSLLNAYPTEPEVYERNAEYWYGNGKYLKCFNILQQAEKKGVSSEGLVTYMDAVKYQCRLEPTRYTDFLPLYQNRMAVHTTDVWNYVDGAGNIVLEGNYEEAQSFAEGRAIVRKNGTLRIVDAGGTVQRMLSEDILHPAGCFGDGFAPVQTASGYAYIDGNGDKVLGPYEFASVFCNGVAAVIDGGQWQIIDTSGNVLFGGMEDVVLDDLGRCSSQGVILASEDGSYILYTLDGSKVKNEGYEDADAFGPDGIAAVKFHGSWGCIDMEGNWVLEPQYEEARSFSNGLAGISVSGVWGFIDRKGELVISCEYEEVGYWNEEGCCMVFSGGFWRLLKRICIGNVT